MDSSYSTPLSKATLTGLFAGIATTLICLGYDIIFRESTDFSLSDIVNVSSIIFFTNVLFLIVGIVYYAFQQIRKGELLYIFLFLSLTVVSALAANNIHRSDIPVLNTEFKHLLVPIVIIMGLAASVGVPFLFHSKKFEEYVL